MNERYRHETATRVMRLLGCFSATTPELRLTDLSECLDLNKAQVLRLASTLEEGGFLARDPITKRYRLGIALLRLGILVQGQVDLRTIARPFLEELVAETQETARLVVPDPDGPVCVEAVDSPKGIRVFAQPGVRMPWNAGASPQLILAFLPEGEQDRILNRGQFHAFTENTLTDPEQLRAHLSQIRERGYHVVSDDLDEGATGVSAPIFDHQARIVGSLNVSAPSIRLSGADVDRFVDLVVAAARSVSAQLGFAGWPDERPT